MQFLPKVGSPLCREVRAGAGVGVGGKVGGRGR